MIPFHKPYLSGKEQSYIDAVFRLQKFSGNGEFTKKVNDFFKNEYQFTSNFFTTSCTDALEMSALLANVQPGDEVILPSYTFVSTANAFALRGAKLIFADSCSDHPNIDPQSISELINDKTKIIVVVHYAGMACAMDEILALAKQHNCLVIEDAAQCINAYYKGKPLGSLGTFGALSFHETKNIHCGEGGLLVVNDKHYSDRAHVIWEKGTDRADFIAGKISSYGWKDIGSSFYPSELNAAFLLAQLEEVKTITEKRTKHWQLYDRLLRTCTEADKIAFPNVISEMNHNAHHYFFSTRNKKERDELIAFLNQNNITASFHYSPLHRSSFQQQQKHVPQLKNAEGFGDCLIRLPLFNSISETEIETVVEHVVAFYKKQ